MNRFADGFECVRNDFAAPGRYVRCLRGRRHRSGAPADFLAFFEQVPSWQHEERPLTIDVTSATLDDADAFAPTREIWVDEKLAWQTLDPALPHYPRSSTDSQAIAY